jgi:hypothetical protein
MAEIAVTNEPQEQIENKSIGHFQDFFLRKAR